MTEVNVAVIRGASTVLKREFLPASDNGLFTDGDSVPKAGDTTGQHTVRRTIRGIRVLKSGPVGFLPRKGELYPVSWDAETSRWIATGRLTGADKTKAVAIIDREKATAQAAAKEAKAASKPKPKAKAKVKASKS